MSNQRNDKDGLKEAVWHEIEAFDSYHRKNYADMAEHFYYSFAYLNKRRKEPVSEAEIRRAALGKMGVFQIYDRIVESGDKFEQKINHPLVGEMLAHAFEECDSFKIDRKYAHKKVLWYLKHHQWAMSQLGSEGPYPLLASYSNDWIEELAKGEVVLARSLTGIPELGGILSANYIAYVLLNDGRRTPKSETHSEDNKQLMRDQYATYLAILAANIR